MDINNTERNHERLRHLLIKLPDICHDYFLAISTNTSILTRLNYATDLSVFFDYANEFCEQITDVNETSEIQISHIKKLTSYDIEKYLDYLSIYSRNNALLSNDNSGKKRKLSSIRTFFKYLLKHKLIDEDPTAIIDTPKIKDKPIIRLTSEEISKLLKTVEDGTGLTPRQQAYHKKTMYRDSAIIILFLGTGIRLSEIIGLNLNDFNFKENAFRVTRKGGSQSILYYSESVKEVLLRYYNQRTKTKSLSVDQKAFFLSMQNKRISHRAIENLVKKYSRLVTPLKSISPHKLRSTYGTQLYNNTGDIYLVADVLGHKDVNTTKKHYAALSENRKKEAPNHINLSVD